VQGDLRAALSSDVDGKLGWRQMGKQIALDITSGLVYLHANGVTHRWGQWPARLPA